MAYRYGHRSTSYSGMIQWLQTHINFRRHHTGPAAWAVVIHLCDQIIIRWWQSRGVPLQPKGKAENRALRIGYKVHDQNLFGEFSKWVMANYNRDGSPKVAQPQTT